VKLERGSHVLKSRFTGRPFADYNALHTKGIGDIAFRMFVDDKLHGYGHAQ